MPLDSEDIGALENMQYFRVLASKRIKETPPGKKNQSKLGEVSCTSNPKVEAGGCPLRGHFELHCETPPPGGIKEKGETEGRYHGFVGEDSLLASKA